MFQIQCLPQKISRQQYFYGNKSTDPFSAQLLQASGFLIPLRKLSQRKHHCLGKTGHILTDVQNVYQRQHVKKIQLFLQTRMSSLTKCILFFEMPVQHQENCSFPSCNLRKACHSAFSAGNCNFNKTASSCTFANTQTLFSATLNRKERFASSNMTVVM